MIKINDYTFSKSGDVEKILLFALEKLGVEEAAVSVYKSDTTLDRVSSGGIIYDALLNKTPINHTYVLYLRERPSVDLLNILCHEATHLHQQERGDLKYDMDTNECLWKGTIYGPRVPYNVRPWEVEAFSSEAKLVMEYRRANKPQKRGCLFKKNK